VTLSRDTTVLEQSLPLDAAVREQLAAKQHRWVPLAASLHAFHDAQAWKMCEDTPTFSAWLGQPDIAMSYRTAKDMIDAWEVFVADHATPVDLLLQTNPSKLAVVLPAVRDGSVPADRAVADAIALSRTDLRELYRNPDADLDADTEPVWCRCDCGHKHRRPA
jgi:hypothetical protein